MCKNWPPFGVIEVITDAVNSSSHWLDSGVSLVASIPIN